MFHMPFQKSFPSRFHRLRILTIVIIAGLLLAAVVWVPSQMALADANPADNTSGTPLAQLWSRVWSASADYVQTDPITAAWERVKDAGSYHFSSDVTQTTTPGASVRNVGRRSQTDQLYLEGMADIDATAMEFRLWSGGGSLLQKGSSLSARVADGKTYTKQNEGDWKEATDFTQSLAPAGDFMSYLVAARGITSLGEETRAGLTFTRYAFTLDGPTFARSVQQQMEEAMRLKGDVPEGIRFAVPSYYSNMTGHGELWVGQDGLPVRQLLTLQFPENKGEAVSAHITVNFSRFGYARSAIQASAGNTPAPIASLLAFLNTTAKNLPAYLAFVTALFLAILLLGSVVYSRRVRRIQQALSLALVFSFVVGPVFNAMRMTRFFDAQTAQAKAQEDKQAESKLARDARSSTSAPAFNPHQNPLAAAPAAAPAEAAFSRPLAGLAAPVAAPALQATTALTTPNGVDSDGDGLTDFAEQRVGTDPASKDTDGDLLLDKQEVDGFTYGGKKWYTDPKKADSNNDDMADTVEWDPSGNGGLPDDTDGDGVPDLFDEDNDGDGVPDGLDLAPFVKGTTTYGKSVPLALQVQNLTLNKPTFVDFQLRPTNADSLWFSRNRLDWPQDDKGQFRDVDNQPEDMTLVPVLEITIPDAANMLPPTAALEPYAINVSQPNNGTQIAYVPLAVVTDEKSGARVAFNGRMRYLPKAAWSTAHTVRLVWVVQMENDRLCNPGSAGYDATTGYCLNQPQIIHRYYEDWTLTGLNVSEQHGADTAVIYEEPPQGVAPDNDDSPLALLANVLEKRLLTAQGAGTSAVRPVTLNNLQQQYDRVAKGTNPMPFGLPNIFRVQKTTHATFDEAIKGSGEALSGVLNSVFATHWANNRNLKPLLMTAYEQKSRSLSLDSARVANGYAAFNGANLTLNMRPTNLENTPITTMVGLKWTPFCGGTGTAPAWEVCAADAYWLEVGTRLRQAGVPNLDPNNPSQIVNTLDADIATGQIVATQLLVFSLMQGINTVIQQEFSPTDNRILSNPSGQESDQAMTDVVRVGLIIGNAGIKFIANLYFIAYATAPAKGFVALSKYVFSSNKQKLVEGLVEAADDLRATKPLTTLGVVVFAAAVVTMVTLMVLAAQGNEKAEIGLSVMLTGVSIGLTVGLPIYATIQAAKTATSIPQLLLGRSELIGASRGAAVVGAALAIGVTWGFFIYGVVSNKVSAFSLEFNAALAETIAATIYIIFLTLLSLTVVGLILVGILTGIDAVLSLVCELKKKDNCFTIGGAATKAIATVIYGYDLTVDPTRSDLIQAGSPIFALANPDQGYVTNATVVITLPLTTTIVHKDPDPKNSFKIAPYLFLFSKDNLRSTTFNYSLTPLISETLSAKRDERPTQWAEPTVDHKYIATSLFRTQKVDNVGLKSGLQFAQPGLNRSSDMYLNMAYALPAYECWFAFWTLPPLPICYIRTFSDGLSNKIDGSFYFDILPDSLTGFMSLAERRGNNFAQAWDTKFTALTDADGDGLLSNASGGLDINDSTWDSDKDGLADAVEIEQRAAGWPYSPGQCDTDSDGLTDKQEAEFGTNPSIADSDNDGLLDREEVWHQEYVNCQRTANWSGGWNVTINETTSFAIRVTSDPTANDSDGDGLSDLAEKQLAENSNPALRVDKQNRPWHPAITNVSPIAVFVDVNDLDRFVGVGQKLVYTTTATTSIAVEPSVLDVNAPAEVGGPKPPALLPFNPSSFNTEQTVSSQTAFTISSGTNRQQLDFTSSVRARLQSASPAPFAWEFAKADLSGIPAQPVRSQAIAPFGRDRQDSYQIPILTSDSAAPGGNGEMRYHLVPANTLGVIPTGGALKMGNTSPDIACNHAQTCLIVRDLATTDGAFSVVQAIEIDATGFYVDAVQFNHGPNPQYQPVIASDGTSFGIAYHTSNSIRFETWGHQYTTPYSTQTVNLPAGQTSTSVVKDLIWMGDRYRLAVKYPSSGGTNYEIALYDFSPAGVLFNTALPVQFQQGSLNNANPSPIAGPALAYDPAHGEALLVYQTIEPMTRRVRIPRNINSNTNWSAFNTYLYLPDSSTTFNSENFDVTYDQRFDKWLINLNGYLTYLSASAVRGNEGSLSPFLTVEPLNKVALTCPAASSLPVGDFRFEEFPAAAAFSNAAPGTLPDGTSPNATCSAGTCPAAGLPGATDSSKNAVGKPASDYSLRFDGMDDQITLPNAPNTPYTLGSEFSIAFWYKADGAATPLTTFYVQGSGNAPGFALNINSATLEFWAGTLASKISAPHSMNDGKWHFVTATRQANGGLALYVDGASKAAGVGSTAPVMPATLIVGGGHRAIGLDDLKLYNAALSGTTVQDLYNRTDQSYCVGVASNKWSKLNISQPDPRGGKIAASGGLSLTVDTDKPTSSLSGLVNGQYVKGLNTYIIGGNASDQTSGVSKVEVSLNNALVYVPASGAESWAYNLPVIEGEYNVRVRATDAVGNVEIPAAPIQIFADLTPPNVALNAFPVTPILPTRNAANVWTTRLTGTALDRLSTNVASGLPANGVEVRLQGLDTDQGNGWQTATRNGNNWTIDYRFDAGLPDPTGTYTVNVRAVDNVGNRTADNAATAILRLDATGPTAALSNQDATRDVLSNTLTLNGEVADTGTAGVDKVEMAFVTIEKIAALPSNISASEADARLNRTWLPATLAQRGATVTRTTWSMAVPAGLEGIYQMDLRASDSLGNVRRSDNIWRGMVDLVAPRVTFTGTETGRRFFRELTTLYEMRYVCRADDWQLNEATFECPGNAQQTPSHGFNTDPALLAQFPGLSLLNVMSNTYTVLQANPQPVGSARACDSTGKCSTTTLAAAVQANAMQTNRSVMAVQAPSTTPRAVILDPTEGSFVALAKGNAAVQVTLAGEASNGLKTIELFVDDALQSTIEFAEADAVKSVIRTVTIATPSSGAHVLMVKATDWAGNTQAELASTSVTFLTGLPSVEIDSEFVVLTETYGLRSNMVILKGRVTTENLAAVKVKVNNGRWADARFANGRWEIAMPVKDLQSGQPLNVVVDAIDKFGQVKQHSMGEQVMLTEGGNPPDTNVIEGPSGETDALTATVSFSSTAGDREVFGFECAVDEGGYVPCASPFALSVVSNGEHTVKVRAIDSEGYVDATPALATWTVRSTQLEVTLTSAPSSTGYSRDADFAFEAEGANGYECALDGGELAACSSPQTYSGLEDGAHAFLVRAKNDGGLVGAATRFTWAVSNSAPVAQEQDVTVANNQSVAITLKATDSDALRYKLVSKPSHGVLHGLAPNVTYVPNTGFVGQDSFTFKATDAESDSEPATVRVTVTEPEPQTEGPSTLTIVLDAQPDAKQNFRFTSNLGNFRLDDPATDDGDAYSNSITFEVTPQRTYVFEEQVPGGWTLSNIVCDTPHEVNVPDATAEIVVNNNEQVTCTFVNVRRTNTGVLGEPGEPVDDDEAGYDDVTTTPAPGTKLYLPLVVN